MTATCETCRFWQEMPTHEYGRRGDCAFPVPAWVFYAARQVGLYAPARMPASQTGCSTHQPKEPDHG
jgi:hypothetical protein